MKYQAVLFDLDGTLLNTLDDLRAAVNAALAAYGYPSRALEEVRRFVGNGVGKLVERALPGGLANPDFPNVFSAFLSYYKSHATDLTLPYPGILPLLNRLKADGIALGMISNKTDDAVQLLADRFFPGLFSVVCGEYPGLARKPAPDMVLYAMRTLQCPPERCAYVGDSETDLLTAKNAKIPCYSVTWGFRSRAELLAASAVCLIDTPEALLHHLEQ